MKLKVSVCPCKQSGSEKAFHQAKTSKWKRKGL